MALIIASNYAVIRMLFYFHAKNRPTNFFAHVRPRTFPRSNLKQVNISRYFDRQGTGTMNLTKPVSNDKYNYLFKYYLLNKTILKYLIDV